MKHLAIDIGNSFIKIGLFEEGQLIRVFPYLKAEEVIPLLETLDFERVILSNVGKQDALVSLLTSSYRALVFHHALDLPIKNCYASPETLGVDRLAAAVAMATLYPDTNCLAIGLGTCITYDFINSSAEYLGGAISPGMQMRFKALHHFTAKLPLVHQPEHASLIANDTTAALQSGVVNGICAEIEGIIGRYKADFEKFNTVLSGGDAIYFASKLKADIFVNSNLVLFGLERILRANA